MRKLLAGAALGIALVSGGAMADPGPNGHNNHGLCTAFFNGNKNGWDKHGYPPPFAALAAAADEAGDGNGEATEEEIRDYCEQFGIGGKGGRG